jgi:hypothetical protein
MIDEYFTRTFFPLYSRPMRKDNVISVTFSFLTVVLVALVVQSFLPRRAIQARPPVPQEIKDCEGTPIQVNAPYDGGVIEEWSCQQQCNDKIQHYLVYTNGVATPCEKLPGCYDYGEDHGITCRIPGTPVSSTTDTPDTGDADSE